MATRIDQEFMVKLITNNSKCYVLDARDDDRIGGHIPNSIHVPDQMDYAQKVKLLNSLLHEIKIDLKQDEEIWIITHCMESICRGPRLASLMTHLLSEQEDINKEQIKIRILTGGAHNWIKKYHLDDTLVENFDDDYWGFYIDIAYSPICMKIQKLIDSIDEHLK